MDASPPNSQRAHAPASGMCKYLEHNDECWLVSAGTWLATASEDAVIRIRTYTYLYTTYMDEYYLAIARLDVLFIEHALAT
ncbi:uncharacterized protein TrAtP1_006232 [Trichoderma atroviride]|uniref:uncharacterized protein n=1 Tax=Hypocrea atroviridis TaxID=63577 RepID=UPI003331E7B9|nr:hypothetical protein TrAtP1_006232 [Trichoderma atroviride]